MCISGYGYNKDDALNMLLMSSCLFLRCVAKFEVFPPFVWKVLWHCLHTVFANLLVLPDHQPLTYFHTRLLLVFFFTSLGEAVAAAALVAILCVGSPLPRGSIRGGNHQRPHDTILSRYLCHYMILLRFQTLNKFLSSFPTSNCVPKENSFSSGLKNNWFYYYSTKKLPSLVQFI